VTRVPKTLFFNYTNSPFFSSNVFTEKKVFEIVKSTKYALGHFLGRHLVTLPPNQGNSSTARKRKKKRGVWPGEEGDDIETYKKKKSTLS
jgi:hypothetical protein